MDVWDGWCVGWMEERYIGWTEQWMDGDRDERRSGDV